MYQCGLLSSACLPIFCPAALPAGPHRHRPGLGLFPGGGIRSCFTANGPSPQEERALWEIPP